MSYYLENPRIHEGNPGNNTSIAYRNGDVLGGFEKAAGVEVTDSSERELTLSQDQSERLAGLAAWSLLDAIVNPEIFPQLDPADLEYAIETFEELPESLKQGAQTLAAQVIEHKERQQQLMSLLGEPKDEKNKLTFDELAKAIEDAPELVKSANDFWLSLIGNRLSTNAWMRLASPDSSEYLQGEAVADLFPTITSLARFYAYVQAGDRLEISS